MFSFSSLILVGLSFGQTPQPVRPFPDVPKTHWAYSAVTELHERGILRGYPSAYDRSTPHAALQSLIKAINNGDEARIRLERRRHSTVGWTNGMSILPSYKIRRGGR